MNATPHAAGCPRPRQVVPAVLHRHAKGPCRSGFTLIELLVVVSIIALLISILLPSLRNAREQAKQVKCLAHMRGMGQAGFTFSQDNRNKFQLVGNQLAISNADPSRKKYKYDASGELLAWPVVMAQSSGITGMERNWDWAVRADDWATASTLKEHISEDFELAICPADKVQLSTPFYPGDSSMAPYPSGISLPSGARYWGRLSYGINEDVVGAEDNNVNPSAGDCWKDGKWGQFMVGAGNRLEGNFSRIYNPGTCLLMVDAGPNSEDEARSGGLGAYVSDAYVNLIISAQAQGPYLGDHRGKWPVRIPDRRHPNGALSITFCDFHAEVVRPVRTWTIGNKEIPAEYTGKPRVSPYKPWDTENL